MTINLSRRGVLATPAVLLLGQGAAAAALAHPPCRWAALAAEREAIFQHASNSFVDGDLPDDIADACWGRVAEIDAEIAETRPSSPASIAAVLRHLAWEIDGGGRPDDPAIVAAMRAAADCLDGAAS